MVINPYRHLYPTLTLTCSAILSIGYFVFQTRAKPLLYLAMLTCTYYVSHLVTCMQIKSNCLSTTSPTCQRLWLECE